MNEEIILQVENLTVEFKTEDTVVQAIQHVSFNLFAGKTLALVGESGSGKSVSALCIMGLLASPPAQIREGKIIYYPNNEKEINLLKPSGIGVEALRGSKISMIFQEPMTSLNPLMKCGDQVAETIILHQGCSKKEALLQTEKLFDEVRLPNPSAIMERYPHELSGGQKQRVMIAIAICCNPVLLIADEPTTALDVTVQKTILDLLKELQLKRGMSILFITHDLNLVRKFADDVLILFKSEMIEYGKTEQIFNSPQEPYTKGLLNCRPASHHRYKFLKTVQETMQVEKEDAQVIISQMDFDIRIQSLQTNKPIIELKELNVWYPTSTNFFGKTTAWYKAVNDVNICIREGETLGLVGESGCGKTTIGKAIVQLQPITSGEILFKGKSIRNFSKSELAAYRNQVQIIFQDPYASLNPRVSIGEAIREPMNVHGILNSNQRKERVMELLGKVGMLPSHYDRYPHEFSGGQRQRICIARALALQPSFIICDESVSALDVSVQAQVLNLLVSLRDEFKLSYLFISHDLAVVKHISDFVAVMQQGKIVELNNAEKIYNSPESKFTQELIDCSI